MKIALFLGAGASMPFGKPVTEELRRRLISSYQNINQEILQSILEVPEFKDIEYVLQAVRDMRKFASSTGGKYFFTNGESGVFNFKNGQLPFSTFIKRLEEIEKTLEGAVYDAYRWNHDYDSILMKIYHRIFDFIKNRSDGIYVFTTNYDRAIEVYCNTIHSEEYRLLDGFKRESIDSEYAIWDHRYDDAEKSDMRTLVRLYKLHGSLNWKFHKRLGIVKSVEENVSTDGNYPKNLVILPTLSPKDEDGTKPFDQLRSDFDKFMKSADVCIVIGFSFRDHLNDIFKEFIERGKTLIVISPKAIGEYHTNILGEKIDYNTLHEWSTNTAEVIKRSDPQMSTDDRDIHLLQKELQSETIDDIIRFLEHVIEKVQVKS